MRYFIVKTKCGHVGRFNCVWIDYAIVASDAKTAALYAKSKARVKKHHKDVIAGVREVNFESFMKQRAENDADPYLHCKNVQQQRYILGFESRIESDEWNIMRLGCKRRKEDSKKYKIEKQLLKENDMKRQIDEVRGEAI